MRTKCFMMLLMMLLITPTGASAEEGFVLCWKALPHIDILKVLALPVPGDDASFALPFVGWIGATAYQMNSASSARVLSPDAGTILFGARFDNFSSFFGGNDECRMRIGIFLDDLTGSWTMDCTGAEKPFNKSGPATPVACLTDQPETARAVAGPLAGE